MAKKKKQQAISEKDFESIQSIEFLIGDDAYTGVKVTRKDKTELTYGSDVISMEHAENLINDFEDYLLQQDSELPDIKEEDVISETTPEPEKVNTAKNMEYTHKLTPEELVEIADEQNALLEENNNLESELELVRERVNPQIKVNEKRINELHRQYSTKILTRTETITPEIDWKKGVMYYLHPETKAILEELPIPLEMRQQSLGFDKSGKKEWVINKNFKPENLSALHQCIYHLLFAGYEPKELMDLFADKMPATASNIKSYIKEEFKKKPGFFLPAEKNKKSLDCSASGIMLKYQIGDDEKKILKGKELCLVVTNVLN